MNFPKTCSPRVTFKIVLTIVAMLCAMFVWLLNLSMGYAADMTALQVQLPAIVKLQEVQAGFNKERFEGLHKKQDNLDKKFDILNTTVNDNMQKILIELRRR